MLLSSLTKSSARGQHTYARMLDGTIPVYSSSRDVYSYDIVQMAIDCIAVEISKLQPRHIRTNTATKTQETVNDSINRLFRFAPNELMTTRDFLEKVIWLLYYNYNAFICPTYDLVNSGGTMTRDYTGFYPLNPSSATFLQDSTGVLFVKFDFQSGVSFTLPYSDVIHLRKRFSQNEIMGGGMFGTPDNTALLKAAVINDTITEGLGKAVKASLSVQGILKINTMLDGDKLDAERKKFEDAIASSTSGILPADLKSEYINLKPDPKLIDKDTLEFIQSKILYWYGVPMKILAGTFNDDEYQAWYEKTLEPLIISLGQAFSKTLFTKNELAHGNEMVFYFKDLMYLSTTSKLNLLKTAGEQGLLTDDQKLAILGYPPLPNGAGARRTQSLNYVSVEIADQYQLKRAGTLDAALNKNKEGEAGE